MPAQHGVVFGPTIGPKYMSDMSKDWIRHCSSLSLIFVGVCLFASSYLFLLGFFRFNCLVPLVVFIFVVVFFLIVGSSFSLSFPLLFSLFCCLFFFPLVFFYCPFYFPAVFFCHFPMCSSLVFFQLLGFCYRFRQLYAITFTG